MVEPAVRSDSGVRRDAKGRLMGRPPADSHAEPSRLTRPTAGHRAEEGNVSFQKPPAYNEERATPSEHHAGQRRDLDASHRGRGNKPRPLLPGPAHLPTGPASGVGKVELGAKASGKEGVSQKVSFEKAAGSLAVARRGSPNIHGI